MRSEANVLIIGGGVAGLTAALHQASHADVSLVCKGSQEEGGASPWAQGGISCVMAPWDTLTAFVADTCAAGDGLNNAEVVRRVGEASRQMVTWLASLGVSFTRDGHLFHYTKEGGHSKRRVVHVADSTGQAVSQALWQAVHDHPRIQVYPQRMALDLIMHDGHCMGAYILDTDQQVIEHWLSPHTILATGGASHVYLHTTEAQGATGDGIAMAYRAGAVLMDLEFNQFHPTCLYQAGETRTLLTEALRGEGAVIRNHQGERFLKAHHPQAELAPRDWVARWIHHEMQQHGQSHVFLDATTISLAQWQHHFPRVASRLAAQGIDPLVDWIPIVPASHYTCGGIQAHLNGRTSIPGLYAIGEVAATGLHGANRLASNSLLECLVMGKNLALHPDLKMSVGLDVPCLKEPVAQGMYPIAEIQSTVLAIRQCMTASVGLVRSRAGCEQALCSLLAYQQQIIAKPMIHCATYWQAYHLVTAAVAILRCVLKRQGNRGAHHWAGEETIRDNHPKSTWIRMKACEAFSEFFHLSSNESFQ